MPLTGRDCGAVRIVASSVIIMAADSVVAIAVHCHDMTSLRGSVPPAVGDDRSG